LRRDIAALDGRLAEPGFFARDPGGAAGAAKDRAARSARLAEIENEWIAAAEALEAADS
jgi:hypothetical protein